LGHPVEGLPSGHEKKGKKHGSAKGSFAERVKELGEE